MMRDILILPLQGRWQHEVLTEGFDQVQLPPTVEGHAGGMTDLIDPIVRATPLRLAFGQPPPLAGEDDLCADTIYDR